MKYDHIKIEKKWQEFWEKNECFKTYNETNKPKYYSLGMFPYPSAAGLHVGNTESYTATDILARYKKMCGYNVLHPMGWDAFGLPAERYALKQGGDPLEFTNKNINVFKQQLKSLGLSYDWDREVSTCDPKYYKWTQWIFIQLYKLGLAELKDIEVNWCEGLGTVLANEEVLIDKDTKMTVSEIGNYPVVKKPMRQWVLKITKYAERLLEDLEGLDWPDSIKDMQRNWIGKSEGALISFQVFDSDKKFEVFTTRPDTIYGATYCVLSCEHPLILDITSEDKKEEVLKYIKLASSKTDLDRTDLNKEKTGIFIGSYAINPFNDEKIPIYIADYVLTSYGTGAIMAVPAHDERDYAFAKKYNIKIVEVLKGGNIDECAYVYDGLHINSDFINGLNKEDASNKIIEVLEKKRIGKKDVKYKLRDWIFSRQRYWGEPFPIIFYEDGSIEILEESKLPLELPHIEKITSSKNGESPLANEEKWLNVVRKDGVKGRRETNTMPQWAGSCWYYIAYIISDKGEYLDLTTKKIQELIDYFLPVDMYIGGAEHAVLHLLYSRFWHKVLYDIGVVKKKEPYQCLFNQGIILGDNGTKMSKSAGNVVNPDDIVSSHGADTLRLYLMFMGPLEATKPWSSLGIEGLRRFLERIYRFFMELVVIEDNCNMDFIYHQTVKKVTEDIENIRFNTAISQLMIFINECYKEVKVNYEYLSGFLRLLNPLAPHISEELNEKILKSNISLSKQDWPKHNEDVLIKKTCVIIVQVNGKLRDKFEAIINESDENLVEVAYKRDKIKIYIDGRVIKKTIVVKNKLVSIIV